MGRVGGKVAVITGGAGGIGSVTCKLLASEGAQVVVADVDGVRAEQVAGEIGDNAVAMEFDAADVSSCENLISRVVDQFGRVDILHNNHMLTAQSGETDSTVLGTSVALWDQMMAVNLRSFFVLSKAAIPHMIEQGGGSIICMATGGARRPQAGLTAYFASKAGVITLAQSIAVQYGREKVRANAILPGVIFTPTMKGYIKDTQAMLPTFPFHRDGTPEDIANLVLFLGSDESSFITGQPISCDGGFMAGDAVPRPA